MPAGEPSTTPVPISATQFRHVMSRFASGVTVVSTADGGAWHGMTVNAFASVSLDPLLVLFCCEKDASLHAPMMRSGRWAVSMLTHGQQDVAEWFAARSRRGTEQFAGTDTRMGEQTGAPILDGALGWLECRTWATYDGGDHTIVVGEVLALGASTDLADPLLYFASDYHTTR